MPEEAQNIMNMLLPHVGNKSSRDGETAALMDKSAF
jgi:hypothetical protein